MNALKFSQQLDDSFKKMTYFFEEISVLLKDCDRLMSENGYTPFTDNTATYEMSKSLLNPEGWIPTYLCRAYVDEEKLEDKSFNNVKFVSIFLRYGISGTHDIKMEENIPLIVAGILIPFNANNFKFEGWLTKRWFWAATPSKNTVVTGTKNMSGSIVDFDYKDQTGYNTTKKMKSFAYPLEDIKNTGILKEKIIDKLIEIDKEISN